MDILHINNKKKITFLNKHILKNQKNKTNIK